MKIKYELHEVNKGWHSLILELHSKLLKIDPNYRIDQIKEKYSQLRYYANPVRVDLNDEEINKFYNLIDEYEKKSALVCEFCGLPGRLATLGWLKTLCDDCLKKHIQERDLTGEVKDYREQV